MPKWGDFSSPVLSSHFKLLWGFHYDRSNGEFFGRLAGDHIREWLGANFWGARLEDIHPPQVAKAANAFLAKVVTVPAAGLCKGRLFNIGSNAVKGERIALPVATDRTNGDGVLGASDYEHVPFSAGAELILENLEWFGV